MTGTMVIVGTVQFQQRQREVVARRKPARPTHEGYGAASSQGKLWLESADREGKKRIRKFPCGTIWLDFTQGLRFLVRRGDTRDTHLDDVRCHIAGEADSLNEWRIRPQLIHNSSTYTKDFYTIAHGACVLRL